MTGFDLRNARMHLGLTQSKLARAARIPVSALAHFERTGHMASPMHGMRDRLHAAWQALEAVDVEFTNGEALGVRLRRGEG